MQFHLALAAAFSTFVCAVPLAAQIVVSGGGANLATAVAAAPDGAVLSVSPGNYDGFAVTGKGLTILGTAGVQVTGGISIANTLPHQAFTLRQLTWPTALMPTGFKLLELTNCLGPILLEELTQPTYDACLPSSPFGICFRTIGIDAIQCAQLYLRNCTVRSLVQCQSCSCTIEACDLRGENTFVGGWAQQLARPALLLAASDATICGNSILRGGDGNLTGGMGPTPAGNGVELYASNLRILDGLIQGGGNGVWPPWSVLLPGSGQLRVSPRAVLTNQSPAVGTVVMPQLTGTSSATSLTATTTTAVGDLVVLVVGLPGPSLTVPGLQDPFWIDPNAHAIVAIGVQQAGVPVSGSVTVPAGNAFRGLTLNWGAACQGQVTGFQATNPVVTLVY